MTFINHKFAKYILHINEYVNICSYHHWFQWLPSEMPNPKSTRSLIKWASYPGLDQCSNVLILDIFQQSSPSVYCVSVSLHSSTLLWLRTTTNSVHLLRSHLMGLFRPLYLDVGITAKPFETNAPIAWPEWLRRKKRRSSFTKTRSIIRRNLRWTGDHKFPRFGLCYLIIFFQPFNMVLIQFFTTTCTIEWRTCVFKT